MYKNIGKFISESPEWVENWVNTPVKTKYKENPLRIAEIIINVINCLPFDNYRKASELNSIWKSWVHYDLYQRQEKMVDKYWNIIAEYKKVVNAYFKAKYGTPEYESLSKKFDKLGKEKGKVFAEQVRVEQTILNCGFADDGEAEKILRHIDLFTNGYDPHEVGWTKTEETVYHWDDEFVNDYWGEEDPDEPDTPSEYSDED